MLCNLYFYGLVQFFTSSHRVAIAIEDSIRKSGSEAGCNGPRVIKGDQVGSSSFRAMILLQYAGQNSLLCVSKLGKVHLSVTLSLPVSFGSPEYHQAGKIQMELGKLCRVNGYRLARSQLQPPLWLPFDDDEMACQQILCTDHVHSHSSPAHRIPCRPSS